MASNLQTLSADVAESWRSIKGNKLRFFLTAAIISIGITALVGILSSLEGIQQSVTANFNKLGSSGIDIIPVGKNTKRRTRFGGDEKFKPLTYQHASFLRRSLTHLGQVAVYTYASYNAEIKGKTICQSLLVSKLRTELNYKSLAKITLIVINVFFEQFTPDFSNYSRNVSK